MSACIRANFIPASSTHSRHQQIMKKDITHLIPAEHRDLIDVVPKGALTAAVLGSVLLGSLVGSVLCLLVPSHAIPIVFATLLVLQRLWVWRSDRRHDHSLKELARRGLDWSNDDS